MANVVRFVSATITHADGFSAGFPLQLNELVCSVQVTATWEGTTDIGVDVSQDNVTFFPIVDTSRAAGTSDFRFINLGTTTALYNTYPSFSLPYPYGTAFFRIRGLNTGSNATVKPAADQPVTVFIAKITDG